MIITRQCIINLKIKLFWTAGMVTHQGSPEAEAGAEASLNEAKWAAVKGGLPHD